MTWDEFISNKSIEVNENLQRTNIECPNCHKLIFVRTDIVLATYPPQRSYLCKSCGWKGTA